MNYIFYYVVNETKTVFLNALMTAVLLMAGFVLNNSHPNIEQLIIINILVVVISLPNIRVFYDNMDSVKEYFERYGG